MRTKVLLLLMVGTALAPLAADPAAAPSEARPEGQRDLGTPSPKAAPDLVRLGYLVGEWTVRNFVRDASGEFVANPVVSRLRAQYLRDGLSLMTEYFEDRSDGFYGFHIVTHDPARGLVHRYFDARRNQRPEFVGGFRGEEYDITCRGGYNGQGDFLYRETDSEITPTSFVKRIYRSDDEGRSFKEGDYYFAFTRVR